MFYIMRILVLTLLVTIIGIVWSCADAPNEAASDHSQQRTISDEPIAEEDQMAADNDEPTGPQIEFGGPKFDFSIEVMESFPEQYALSWNVTTNTGGWVLTTDEVKHKGTFTQVYLTLVQPGPDEIVTMALVTHRARYDAGTAEIARAELYVRLKTRGSVEEPPYLLAAIAP